jgi:hypothetical protein
MDQLHTHTPDGDGAVLAIPRPGGATPSSARSSEAAWAPRRRWWRRSRHCPPTSGPRSWWAAARPLLAPSHRCAGLGRAALWQVAPSSCCALPVPAPQLAQPTLPAHPGVRLRHRLLWHLHQRHFQRGQQQRQRLPGRGLQVGVLLGPGLGRAAAGVPKHGRAGCCSRGWTGVPGWGATAAVPWPPPSRLPRPCCRCREWEAAAQKVPKGVRLAVLRVGIVLAADGGALGRMLPIFQLFAGGWPAGSVPPVRAGGAHGSVRVAAGVPSLVCPPRKPQAETSAARAEWPCCGAGFRRMRGRSAGPGGHMRAPGCLFPSLHPPRRARLRRPAPPSCPPSCPPPPPGQHALPPPPRHLLQAGRWAPASSGCRGSTARTWWSSSAPRWPTTRTLGSTTRPRPSRWEWGWGWGWGWGGSCAG